MILKEELLSILEQNRHQVMSGQLLANQLNVSRMHHGIKRGWL